MVISLRKWLRSVRYIFVFVVLVYVISRLFGVFDHWLFPNDPYRSPEGVAVKAGSIPTSDQGEGPLERLKTFYRLGE